MFNAYSERNRDLSGTTLTIRVPFKICIGEKAPTSMTTLILDYAKGKAD